MSMETHEEAMAAANTNSSSSVSNDHSPTKGKRTKRQRLLHLPPQLAAAAAASSTSSSSGEFSGSTTEEEEDMANCLILLAQGRAPNSWPKPEAHVEEGDVGAGGERLLITTRRLAEGSTTTDAKPAGLYAYECKTCNKCFPSFQALGGHRASHKKPKTATVAAATAPMEEKKKLATHDNILHMSIASSYPPNIHSNNKARVHECSVCGSEFSSGQALGGHMRRHRAAAVPDTTQEVRMKEKTVFSLDLNLPAPMDDDRGDLPAKPPTSFPFSAKPPIIFSASPLVDCHY
uniref:Zinc finger protein ZAT5 n=1 Tax=Anthurium amnicola TaxID=1678845 RepID=A0A1D1YR17_9ARAE